MTEREAWSSQHSDFFWLLRPRHTAMVVMIGGAEKNMGYNIWYF
jgi:hypothetical protein